MPCKHVGGTSKCKRDRCGNCKEYANAYAKTTRISANTGASKSDAGQAGEHLVAADLLRRNLPTTKPLNVNGADDLHVKCSGRWYTVQVKLALVNKKTGTIYKAPGKITSDIKAFVDLKGMRIRYETYTDEPLPKELT